jgi:predicted HTH transcriptional regulator
MREQGLLLRNERGEDEVTNGAILLFGKNTQQYVPQAVIPWASRRNAKTRCC